MSKLVALAGGVGAARFLRGLVRVVNPADVAIVVNTGDDFLLHGLHISPDLDTITYTLGGGVHPDQGWGREGETLAVSAELAQRYGRPEWFTLGDRDIATHLVRTEILRVGGTLSQATAEIARCWGLECTLLPMSDDPVATRVRSTDGRVRHFQEWWVGEGAGPDVEAVWLEGASDASPAPGVLEAIAAAAAVIVCPSNPVVSIGTILEVPGIRDALREAPVVGISPIVGGTVVRGMADKLLPAMGTRVSADAVAERYADFCDAWVVDREDVGLLPAVERLGVAATAADTIMRDEQVSAALARTALDLLERTR